MILHLTSKEILSGCGLKITKTGEAVVSLLFQYSPISVPELLTKLHSQGITVNKTTLYRMLQKLTDKQAVQELTLQPGILHFELKSDSEHHHHLVCNSCRKVEHLESEKIEEPLLHLEQILSETTRFSGITHSLEFFGICHDCSIH